MDAPYDESHECNDLFDWDQLDQAHWWASPNEIIIDIAWKFSIKTYGFSMAIHRIFNEEPLETFQMHLLKNHTPINQPLMGPMISARHLSMSLWMLPMMSPMSAMISLIGISWIRLIGEHHQMK